MIDAITAGLPSNPIARAAGWIGLLLFTVALVGCGDGGPPRGYVTGKVTLDGDPVEYATVTFSPEGKGAPSYGITDAAGQYELKYTDDKYGALLGKHRVTISTFYSTTDPDDRPSVDELIPPAWSEQGEIREVQSGSQVINFKIGR